MSAGVGRNDPCPCGSGAKAKRCHPERVGERPESPAARRAREWGEAVLADVASMPGYVPPPDGEDGWIRAEWRSCGCPYGVCADPLLPVEAQPRVQVDAHAEHRLGGCGAGCGV